MCMHVFHMFLPTHIHPVTNSIQFLYPSTHPLCFHSRRHQTPHPKACKGQTWNGNPKCIHESSESSKPLKRPPNSSWETCSTAWGRGGWWDVTGHEDTPVPHKYSKPNALPSWNTAWRHPRRRKSSAWACRSLQQDLRQFKDVWRGWFHWEADLKWNWTRRMHSIWNYMKYFHRHT